jgi:hypothetical protein
MVISTLPMETPRLCNLPQRSTCSSQQAEPEGRNVVRVDGESTMEGFLTKFQAGQALRKVAFAEVRSAKPQKQFFFREKRFPAFNIAFRVQPGPPRSHWSATPECMSCLCDGTQASRKSAYHKSFGFPRRCSDVHSQTFWIHSNLQPVVVNQFPAVPPLLPMGSIRSVE